VAFNSLFLPTDSFGVKYKQHKDLRPATYHHLEVLLAQLEDEKLYQFAERVTSGSLPSSYDPSSYLEVLIPPIEVSAAYIEHIHIDTRECKLSSEEIKAFSEGLGIPLTNTLENPYEVMRVNFMQHIEHNEIKEVKALLKTHPSLMRITNA